MSRLTRRTMLATALALAGAAACSPARPPKTYRLTIADMAFGPAPTGLRVGDTIEWVNNDIFQHSATARDGSFDVDLPPKSEASTVLKTPGSVAFYCKYHPGMTSQLVVAS
jgi:plastocyanin